MDCGIGLGSGYDIVMLYGDGQDLDILDLRYWLFGRMDPFGT